MKKAAGVIFFFAWLLCGCSIDQVFDDWRACVIFIIALITAIASIIALNKKGIAPQEGGASTGALDKRNKKIIARNEFG